MLFLERILKLSTRVCILNILITQYTLAHLLSSISNLSVAYMILDPTNSHSASTLLAD